MTFAIVAIMTSSLVGVHRAWMTHIDKCHMWYTLSRGDSVLIIETYWHLVDMDQNDIVHIPQYQLNYYTHQG